MLLDHLGGVPNYCRTRTIMGAVEAISGNMNGLLRRSRRNASLFFASPGGGITHFALREMSEENGGNGYKSGSPCPARVREFGVVEGIDAKPDAVCWNSARAIPPVTGRRSSARSTALRPTVHCARGQG